MDDFIWTAWQLRWYVLIMYLVLVTAFMVVPRYNAETYQEGDERE